MKFEYDNAGSDKAMLPLPDPSDISQAMLVNFDDINKELKKTRKEFDGKFYHISLHGYNKIDSFTI